MIEGFIGGSREDAATALGDGTDSVTQVSPCLEMDNAFWVVGTM